MVFKRLVRPFRTNHMQQVEIRLKGQIDKSWSDQLGGLTVSHTAKGETILTGTVRDQSALYGVLNRLPVLGLELISINTSPEDTNFHVEEVIDRRKED
jgi:hypothetical protein